ncbi:MAG: putative manganese-dependent inorganic diphosphatase [Lachnospiraceae bacterium]|nr:putative manganese-dependent inorganic diphosphatase [Lachnospiraceae bacterium]
MKKEAKIFIIGHRNPDTDSICSAIAYADIKNRTCKGKYIPKRAGSINEETTYVLNFFQVPIPGYLPDVQNQVKDLEMRETPGADKNMSIKRAWKLMQEYNAGTLPVVNEDGILEGLITRGDIAKSCMNAYDNTILSQAAPKYSDIADTLDGQIITGDETSCFEKGKVWSGASQPDMMENLIGENDLVIVGNRTDAQLCAIDVNVSCMIVCMGSKISKSIQTLAAAKNIVIILTPYDVFTVTRLIHQSIPIRYFMKKDDLITFRKDDYIEQVKDIMTKNRFREFPVVNSKGKYMGTISRSSLLNIRKKQLILVDHNERSQTIDNIDDAEILEIIDHHRIGSLETFQPVLFRNQPVGCTATIIYQIYQELALDIPSQIAGCLCAAILSDTLMFRSPTCTPLDISAANALSFMAGIQIEEFARQMFRAGSNFSDKTSEEIFYQDYKKYIIEDTTLGIGQISFMSEDALSDIKNRLIPYIETEYKNHGVHMLFFMLTNIMNKSTELICYGKGCEQLIAHAYDVPVVDHCCSLKDIISRKKQLLPKLMQALQA